MKELLEDIALTTGLELIPVAWGAAVAGVGRGIGEDILPAVPLLMDFMTNAQGYCSFKGMWNLVKYGLGVGSVYAGKIIPLVNQYLS